MTNDSSKTKPSETACVTHIAKNGKNVARTNSAHIHNKQFSKLTAGTDPKYIALCRCPVIQKVGKKSLALTDREITQRIRNQIHFPANVEGFVARYRQV